MFLSCSLHRNKKKADHHKKKKNGKITEIIAEHQLVGKDQLGAWIKSDCIENQN